VLQFEARRPDARVLTVTVIDASSSRLRDEDRLAADIVIYGFPVKRDQPAQTEEPARTETPAQAEEPAQAEQPAPSASASTAALESPAIPPTHPQPKSR
jgi:hypothetical protein